MKKYNFLIVLLFISSQFIIGQNCPEKNGITPPSGVSQVSVQIVSIKLNNDMEGDDDYVPFYDNKADVYGKVIIDGESFDLPKIEDDNYPHWTSNGLFNKTVTSNVVNINIELKEADGGITFDDDDIDINPDNSKSDLDFEFDMCSMMVGGDIQNHSSRDLIVINSGSGSNQGVLTLRITTLNGRPATTDDLALTDIRFVQVVFDPEAIVTNKPTVVMAQIVNNYNSAINTNFNFSLSGSGLNIQNSFPVSLLPFEVKKEYFFVQNPIRFPFNSAGVNSVAYMASIDDPGSANLPGDDCRAINDGSRRRHFIKVVPTPIRFKILWAKTGSLLDGFNLTPDDHFDAMMDLGSSYIDVTYPLSNIYHKKSPIEIVPPLSGQVLAFITTVLSPFTVGASRVAEPYAMIIELDAMAHLLQYDRIFGVLPSWDWFDRFPFMDEVIGLSLGEFMPQAVLFEPRGENKGPAITLPAHELGHTFGLSVDSHLKETIDNSWVCDISWPIIEHAGCGIVGGYDEYKSEDFPDGNIASGYWIEQGTNSNELDSLINNEQCNSNCFMGPSIADAQLNWGQNGKWIDNPDYNHLVQELAQESFLAQNSLYITGLIAHNDSVYISNVFKKEGQQKIILPDTVGVYQISFKDHNGLILKNQNIKLQWKYTQDSLIAPLTSFRVITEFTNKFDHFTISNRKTNTEIFKFDLSTAPPYFSETTINRSKKPGSYNLKWKCTDFDSSILKFMVLAKTGRDDWIPLSSWITEFSLDIKYDKEYSAYKVLAWDSVNLVESEELKVYSK